MECCPGGHYWDYNPDILHSSQVTDTVESRYLARTRENQLVALAPWTQNFSDAPLATARMTDR